MDINYFLLVKNKLNSVSNHINSIMDIFDDVALLTQQQQNENDSFIDIFDPEMNKNIFVVRQNHIIYLKNICERYINDLCHHEFILDTIDITPDRSKTISYCKFCEMDDPNF